MATHQTAMQIIHCGWESRLEMEILFYFQLSMHSLCIKKQKTGTSLAVQLSLLRVRVRVRGTLISHKLTATDK